MMRIIPPNAPKVSNVGAGGTALSALRMQFRQRRSSREDVVVHLPRGSTGIAVLECRHDGAMFREGLLDAAVEAQGVAACQFEELTRVVNQLRQPAVAGELLQGVVEGLVGFEELVGVVGGAIPLKVGVDDFEA